MCVLLKGREGIIVMSYKTRVEKGINNTGTHNIKNKRFPSVKQEKMSREKNPRDKEKGRGRVGEERVMNKSEKRDDAGKRENREKGNPEKPFPHYRGTQLYFSFPFTWGNSDKKYLYLHILHTVWFRTLWGDITTLYLK